MLWLPGRGQGKELGGESSRMERGARRAPLQACPKGSAYGMGLKQWLHEGVVVDWQKLLPPKGFVVLPRRWVVEMSQPQCRRTCSFLGPLGSRVASLPTYSPAWSPLSPSSVRRNP